MHLQQAYGHAISLDAYRLPPLRVADRLQQAGLTVDATLVRDPDTQDKTPQAFLTACAPHDRPGGRGVQRSNSSSRRPSGRRAARLELACREPQDADCGPPPEGKTRRSARRLGDLNSRWD